LSGGNGVQRSPSRQQKATDVYSAEPVPSSGTDIRLTLPAFLAGSCGDAKRLRPSDVVPAKPREFRWVLKNTSSLPPNRSTRSSGRLRGPTPSRRPSEVPPKTLTGISTGFDSPTCLRTAGTPDMRRHSRGRNVWPRVLVTASLGLTTHRILMFPPNAQGRVNLTSADAARLKPEGLLNDSLIEFCLKYAFLNAACFTQLLTDRLIAKTLVAGFERAGPRSCRASAHFQPFLLQAAKQK
jgi:hypothetical protein